MHQLRIDYSMNRGHEMTIDRESGIIRSEIDELELQMLSSQKIPYFLPIDWFEMNGKVSFRYSLTGTRKLVHRLQQETLSMEQYYSLLLSLTDALIDCKDYMLRQEGCLLHESFIFMGDRLGDIRLVYLPLRNMKEEALNRSDDLLYLIVRWTTYVESIDGAGLKQIVQLLQNSPAPLADLRETLLELISNGNPAEIKNRDMDGQKPQTAFSRELEAGNASMLQPPHITPIDDADHPLKLTIMDDGEDIIPYSNETGNTEGGRKGKWIGGAVFVFATACVWRYLYFTDPIQSNLLISAALTLLFLASFVIMWRRGSTLFMAKRYSLEESEWFEPHSEELDERSTWGGGSEHKQLEIAPSTTNSRVKHSVASYQVAAPTACLGSDSDTLNAVTELLGSDGGRYSWLLRIWNGQKETIRLDVDRFKIGRSGDGVCYTENAEGVSRLHLEVERIEGIYHAKDLGSRNGSLLNGKIMVPYKAYKLESGDHIQLAGEKGPIYEWKPG